MVVSGFYGWRYFNRLGMAADVTQFTPADADAVLWIPRADEFTAAMLTFSRGIQEASRLRELLKPETGVDLGDEEGLRKVGVDPEAGLVVFSRHGMTHILFGVEDAKTFLDALQAKFINLGHPPARPLPPGGSDVVIHVVTEKEGDEIHAAFAAYDGLLVLVYRGSGTDPAEGVRATLAGTEEVGGFFDSATFEELEDRLGRKGPLLYLSGDRFARGPDGQPRLGFLDGIELPAIAMAVVRGRVAEYLRNIAWAAARVDVTPCAANVQLALEVKGDVTLIPSAWLVPESTNSPDFGRFLPRDSVVVTRLGVNLAGPTAAIRWLLKVASFGGVVDDDDPIAGLLGSVVHKDLSDRHLLTDVVDHLTGHIALAVVGVHRKAKLSDVVNIEDPRLLLGSTLQLVAGFQLQKPKAFWEKWWAKRDVLGEAGFDVVRLVHPEWQILKLERHCKPAPRNPAPKGPPPPCERYGLLLIDDLLLLTTGPDTLERVYEAASGNATNLRGLTREPLAQGVLEHERMLAGGYFSFDGLLKAIRNRNLPGGATRYLAQMYELAFTIDTSGGDVRSQLLLTR